MKKILFLTPYLPSNKAGGENFTRLLLEKLSCGCEVDLIYFKYSNEPYYEIPSKNIRIISVLKNSLFVKLKNIFLCPFVHPLFSIRFDRKLLSYLKYLVERNQYDLFYLDHSQMFLYGRYFPEIPKVLMAHDIMQQRYSRRGNFMSRLWVSLSEKKCFSVTNATIFTFSPKDSELVYGYYNKSAFVTNFFLDDNTIKAIPEKINNTVVFFGKWKRRDNLDGLLWFFENVYPRITRQVEIVIIGVGLPEAYIHKYSNVRYLGYVDNPYPIIANALLLVSPLFSGAGVKVKVVEALACGTPVLGTDISFEGIDSSFQKMMYRAETPDDFAKILNNILINIEERKGFKKFFSETYHKQSIVKFLQDGMG